MTETGQANAGGEETVEQRSQEDIARGPATATGTARVTRLSRKMLASTTALGFVLVCGAVLWALQNNRKVALLRKNFSRLTIVTSLTGLAGYPRTMPAFRAMCPDSDRLCQAILAVRLLRHRDQSGPLAVDAEQQRVNQESEAARTSKVFASTNVRPLSATTPPNDTPANAASSSDEAFTQNGQDRKLAFVNASVDRRTTSPDRLAKPASPFVVQAGTVIPGCAHHGNTLRFAGPDHGAGYRKCV